MTESQQLVARLLNAPDIARVVPRLPPEVLHRVIDRCGLESCADIVALATPPQLRRVLDLDLWRAPAPGGDETLDPERFGVWLETLLQLGAEVAAERLEAMGVDLVVGGLAEHVRVFDGLAVAAFETMDGETIPGRTFGTNPTFEVGGFVVEGRRPSVWGAIVELLAELRDHRPAFFHRVMRGCVALSNGATEADGFHALLEDRDQSRFDLAAGREARRDRQGYVAPPQARAFLQAARQIPLKGGQPPADAVARASLLSLAAEPLAEDAGDVASPPAAPSPDDTQAVAAVMGILTDAGVQPRALLASGAEASRFDRVYAFAESHVTAPEELAFLANAVVAGGGIQGRPFTPQEASDLVLATCNLGLEHWPGRWPDRDLVTAFQVGWAVLHRDVGRRAASALVAVLADLEISDRDVHKQLQLLRRQLKQHLRAGEPWRARPALESLLMLDAPAWSVLQTLIDECPALPVAITSPGSKTIDPGAFTFVARTSEIRVVDAWLEQLASTLTE